MEPIQDASMRFFTELKTYAGQIVSGKSAMPREAVLICRVLFFQFWRNPANHKLCVESDCYRDALEPFFDAFFPGALANADTRALKKLVCDLLPQYAWSNADASKPRVQPWILGYVFERWIDQRQTGAYFTPDALAHHIAQHALEEWLSIQFQKQNGDPDSFTAALASFHSRDDAPQRAKIFDWINTILRDVRVADLSCGGGAFLVAAVRALYQLARFTRRAVAQSDSVAARVELLEHILAHNIFGMDIQPEAIDVARLRLWLCARELEPAFAASAPPMLLPNLVAGDALAPMRDQPGGTTRQLRFDIVPEKTFAPVARAAFDICLGNPPFIALSQRNGLTDKNKFIAQWNDAHPDYALRTTSDLSNFFILRGAQTLKPNGILTYITSRNFFDTRYGEPLRRFLTRQVELRHLYTLQDHPFIQQGIKVKANTAILTLANQSPVEPLRFQHLMFWNQPLADAGAQVIDRAALRDSQNWTGTLFDNDLRAELRARCRNTLSDYARAKMGAKTGCNEFFLLRADSEIFARYFAKSNGDVTAPIVRNSRDIAGFLLPAASAYRILNLTARQNAVERGYAENARLDLVSRYIFQHGIAYPCAECQSLAVREHHARPERFPHPGMCAKCRVCKIEARRCDRPVDRLSTQGHLPEWYTLALTKPPIIAVQCIVDTEIGVFFNASGLYVTDQFQMIESSSNRETDSILFLYLCSRVSNYLLEGIGLHRARFDGSFMLKIQVEHLNALPCPDFAALTRAQKNRLRELFEQMARVPNRKSPAAKQVLDEIDLIFLQNLGYSIEASQQIQPRLRAALEQAIFFRWEKTRSRN